MQAIPDTQGDNHESGRSPGQHEPSRLPDVIRMGRLAESFRCLEYKPGVRPWNAAELAEWVRSGDATVAEAQAAAFVLEVANMTVLWEGVPAFNVHDAVALWTKDDRAAFAAWAKDPWFA